MIKNGTSAPDNFCASVIKNVLHKLTGTVLTHICQLGGFPHELKCAKIIPLYKYKIFTLFSNY